MLQVRKAALNTARSQPSAATWPPASAGLEEIAGRTAAAFFEGNAAVLQREVDAMLTAVRSDDLDAYAEHDISEYRTPNWNAFGRGLGLPFLAVCTQGNPFVRSRW